MSVFQLDGFYQKICYIHYTYMDTPWHTQYGCSNLDIACRKGMLEVVKYLCELSGTGEEMMMSTKKVRNCALRVTSCIICAYNMNGVGDDDDVNQQGEKLHILLSHVYMHTNDYMDGMR